MQSATIGIVILFAVSMVVRIMPTFIRLPFSEKTHSNIKTLLPVAVFINLLVYCMVSEIEANPLAAPIGFMGLFFALIFLKRLGLLGAIILACALYFYFQR